MVTGNDLSFADVELRKFLKSYPHNGLFQPCPVVCSSLTSNSQFFKLLSVDKINELRLDGWILQSCQLQGTIYATEEEEIESICEKDKIPVLLLPPEGAASMQRTTYNVRVITYDSNPEQQQVESFGMSLPYGSSLKLHLMRILQRTLMI